MLDFRPVGYIIGWLVAGLGMLMLAPFTLDLLDGNPNARAFAVSAVLVILFGAAIAIACADGRRIDLGLRQGFLLTSGVWAAYIVASALPLMIGAPSLSFTDAAFETTSALTTSGGTVIVGLDHMPRGVLLWRGLLCGIGGIGIVLMGLILLPALNVGGMQLLKAGDFNTLDKIMPRARQIALSCGGVYLVLILSCMLGYIWGGMSAFDAFVQSMPTVATAGMGNYDLSFVNFSPAVHYVSIVFMLLGAMSFIRFVQFARGDPRAVFADSQIRAFLLIYAALCVGLVIARVLADAPINEETIRQILFNMASIITTTGFISTDYSLWGGLSDVLFFCAMMICGCSGSTCGGPKVFRYQLLFAAISAEIRRLYRPNLVITPHYQGLRVSDDVMDSVAAFFMLFFLSLGIGAVLLVMLDVDPLSAISGAIACLSNVGPGLGPVVGPYGNYASLPDPAVWVLTFLMLAGRLELMVVYVLFTPVYWRA